MNASQLIIVAIFMLLCFASAYHYTETKQLSNTNKLNRRREKAQRKYNDKLMEKNTININDRIYYNKLVSHYVLTHDIRYLLTP